MKGLREKRYRINEAAEILGVSSDTLKSWAKKDKVPARRQGPRGHWRVRIPSTPIPAFDLYLSKGLAAPWIKENLQVIAIHMAALGPKATFTAVDNGDLITNKVPTAPAASKRYLQLLYTPHTEGRRLHKILVEGVLKWGLHKKVRHPKYIRVYRPGGQVWWPRSQQTADLLFAFLSFFDATDWKDPFSWDTSEPDTVKTRMCDRLKNIWKDMYPEEMEDDIPEGIKQLRDNDVAFARYEIDEMLRLWMMGDRDVPNKPFPTSCVLSDNIGHSLMQYDLALMEARHLPKSLSAEGFALLASMAPGERWARRLASEEYAASHDLQPGTAVALFFKDILRLTERQRTILTAYLICRQKKPGETVSREEILREMEAEWNIHMSMSALRQHFQRGDCLKRFIECFGEPRSRARAELRKMAEKMAEKKDTRHVDLAKLLKHTGKNIQDGEDAGEDDDWKNRWEKERGRPKFQIQEQAEARLQRWHKDIAKRMPWNKAARSLRVNAGEINLTDTGQLFLSGNLHNDSANDIQRIRLRGIIYNGEKSVLEEANWRPEPDLLHAKQEVYFYISFTKPEAVEKGRYYDIFLGPREPAYI